MGKRKKAAKKPGAPKRKEKLNTVFQCLFCNHEDSVSVTLDKKANVGNLHCKVCGQSFQTPVNYLSAAVDVYADWIDACDAVAKETATERSSNRMAGPPRAQRNIEDDFIDNDEVDAEGEYDDDE